MRRATLLVIAILGVGPAPAVAAQAKVELPDVEDEVMCVSCNVPLNIADSPQADEQRARIRELIAAGRSKEEIKAQLVEWYGDDVLALPSDDDGIGVAAYAVPLAVVAALAAMAALLLPRWRRRGATAPAAAGGPAVTDAELQRLDEDLRRRG